MRIKIIHFIDGIFFSQFITDKVKLNNKIMFDKVKSETDF